MSSEFQRSSVIDRLGPARRPQYPVRGYQQWRSLLFLHWPVPLDVIRNLVPTRLELDLYEGQAYVGIVPFAMQGVRPWWWPDKLAFRFLETNVRTYVVGGNQPGIYFFSLDAASRLAVWTARQFWNLPYYQAEMSIVQRGDEIDYRTRRRDGSVQHSVRFRPGKLLGPSQPGSLEFFFLERYLLFVEQHRRLMVGQVHHSPYPAQTVEVLEVQDQLAAAAGLGQVDGPPAFAHYAAAVDVEVFALRPVN